MMFLLASCLFICQHDHFVPFKILSTLGIVLCSKALTGLNMVLFWHVGVDAVVDCNCHVQDKLEKQHATHHRTVSELETKLTKAEAFNDAMQKYVREIEQANDDLERAKR